jgi:hypothetical protein
MPQKRRKHQKAPKKAQPHLAPQAIIDQRNGTSQTLPKKYIFRYFTKANFFLSFFNFFLRVEKIIFGQWE